MMSNPALSHLHDEKLHRPVFVFENEKFVCDLYEIGLVLEALFYFSNSMDEKKSEVGFEPTPAFTDQILTLAP